MYTRITAGRLRKSSSRSGLPFSVGVLRNRLWHEPSPKGVEAMTNPTRPAVPPDDLKLKSSATLFAHVSSSGSVFHQVLAKYYRGGADKKTLQLLGVASDTERADG